MERELGGEIGGLAGIGVVGTLAMRCLPIQGSWFLCTADEPVVIDARQAQSNRRRAARPPPTEVSILIDVVVRRRGETTR